MIEGGKAPRILSMTSHAIGAQTRLVRVLVAVDAVGESKAFPLFLEVAFFAGNPPVGAPLMFYMIVDGKGAVRMLEAADHFAAYYSTIVSPDTKYLYAAMDELYKVDMKTGQALAFDHLERGTVYSLATSSDGKKIYAGPAGPDLVVYDAETLKQIGMIPLKSDGVAMTRISK